MTAVLVAQSRGQISQMYWETEAESIVANCALLVAHTPSSLETAEFFAARSALSAADIMGISQHEELLLVPGRTAFRCGKVEYYRDERFRARANGGPGELRAQRQGRG